MPRKRVVRDSKIARTKTVSSARGTGSIRGQSQRRGLGVGQAKGSSHGPSKKRTRPPVYYLTLSLTIVLLLFGLIMVLSASSVRAYAALGDSYFYVKRQLIWTTFGLLFLVVFLQLGYKRVRKLSSFFMIGSLFLLVLVLVPGIGHSAGGASRWLNLGWFPLQPSELAKLAIIIYAADVLSKKREKIGELRELLVPLVPVLVAAVALVMAQPDLGTTLMICLSVVFLMLLAGAKFRHLAGFLGTGLAFGSLAILLEPYRFQRLLGFIDPWSDVRGKGYHLIQSLLAFGSGGWRGIGLGLSRQKFFYLPAAHTDFIFAIIGEELGLLGTLFVVILFAALTACGIVIALRCKNLYGRLLAGGVTAMITSQALINMGAVTGVLPITGIPLPLVSYGGSSLIITLSQIGLLLSVGSDTGKRARAVNEDSDRRRRNSGARLSRLGAGPRTSRIVR